MRKFYNKKKSFYITLTLLLIIFISLGYAILTETLYLKNTISYSKMKWDVGFSEYEENLGTIPSTALISEDGKLLTVTCNTKKSLLQETCIVTATIKNDSSFNIGLSKEPIITYDDKYIHTVTFKWVDHPTFSNTTVHKNGFIKESESQKVIITIKTKNLTKETLPTVNMKIPVTIELDFEEYQKDTLPEKDDLAILTKRDCSYDGYDFTAISCNETIDYTTFKYIYFEDKINIPEGANLIGDISANQNESIIAFTTSNYDEITGQSYTNLYIQSNDQIYANEDMSLWFYSLFNLEKINGLELVDTSMTTNMLGLFAGAGTWSDKFTLDISSLDTSNVTEMAGMFYNIGYNNEQFTLDVSKMDTSNVRSMYGLFNATGYNSTIINLDLSNFNTSNVTDMMYMFYQTGYNSTKLNTSITIRNPNVSYSSMLNGVATQPGTQLTINYTKDTESIVDDIINTKSDNSNVIKGNLVK